MKQKKRKNLRRGVLISVIIIIGLVIIFGVITKYISKYTGLAISNLECDSDIKIYINSEDIGKTIKNLELSDYIYEFEVFNCFRNSEVCLEKNITVFPTWEIDGNRIEKDINESQFEELSNCKLL